MAREAGKPIERRFRKGYETCVRKLHDGSATVDDLFDAAPRRNGRILSEAFVAFSSLSVWLFSIGLAALRPKNHVERANNQMEPSRQPSVRSRRRER